MPMSDITPLRPVRPSVPGIAMGPDLERVTNEAIAALARNEDLFQRSGELVEIVKDNPPTRGLDRRGPIVRIHRCSDDRIQELLSREQWLGPDSNGGQRVIRPPKTIARMVLARGTWPGIRQIVEVATAPTMRIDGTIISQPGYDDATGIYLLPSVEVEVPDRPTRDDALAAVELLLGVIADFPVTAEGRSVWMAAVLSVAVRPAIDGSVPMFIFNATVAGSGKGLMVDTATGIAIGRPAAKTVYSGEDAETRKMITAVLLIGGDPVVVLDNVEVELGDQALDMALTTETWRDRVLGQSAMTRDLPMRVVFFATGNGISIRNDLRRRALLVQLEPAVERPEERSDFRQPRLLEYVRENRAQLLGAALTVVRAYVVAGRPDMKLRPMGSFDRWSDLVRSALVWSGQPDPCDTIAELRAADVRTDALRAVVDAWPAADKEIVTVADLLERATPESAWRAALVEWCAPRAGADLPTSRTIGNALRVIRRRVVDGRMLDTAGRGKQGTQWMRLDPSGASVHPVHQVGTPTRETKVSERELETDTPDAQIHQDRPPGEDDQ
jgi:hypothetical protein